MRYIVIFEKNYQTYVRTVEAKDKQQAVEKAIAELHAENILTKDDVTSITEL